MSRVRCMEREGEAYGEGGRGVWRGRVRCMEREGEVYGEGWRGVWRG
jgi:hypothetical protein